MDAQVTSPPTLTLKIVAVAASAGGLRAISAVLSALPSDFPAAFVIVQHLSPHQPSQMAEILGRRIALAVTEAEDGEMLCPSHVYLAPPDYHLLVRPDYTLSLTQTDRVHFSRPSGNVLLESVAASCRSSAIAVILTGGDGDGATGLKAVKDAGGVTIAQDQASSESFSMPRTAIETGAVDHVLPLEAIAPMLVELVQGSGIVSGH